MTARRLAISVVVVLAVALLLVAAHLYTSVRQELTGLAMARRLAVAQLAAATQSERLDRMVDLAVSLATRVRFAEQVAAGEWEAAARILRSIPEVFRFVERVFITDVHGTLMADVPALAGVRGRSFAHRDWFQGVTQAWRPYVSGVYRRAAAPAREVIAVAAPIVDRGGNPSGILVLQLKPELFFDWAQGLALSEGASLIVLDSGEAVAYDSTGGSRGGDLATHPVALKLDKRQTGVELARDGTGAEHVHAFVPARHGWSVMVRQPAAVAFAARDAQLQRLLGGYGVIALLFGVTGILAWRMLAERQRAEHRLAERLRILHEVDRAVIAEQPGEAIAAAVIQPLRELLGVPRAIVNRFDRAAGEVEWIAAAGRRRTRIGGVRYPVRFIGDVEALARGEPQRLDARALPEGPERDALLASGIHAYLAVPMLAGGELIGALSFGGESDRFSAEQIGIAREVATQLAIAILQAQLLERVRRHALELEQRVAERTAELDDLYNRAPCGYHSVNADGLIVRINDTWLSWLGYGRDEVVGRMKHAELMTAASAEYFWAKAFPAFKRDGCLDGVEFEYRRKDGSTFVGSLNATAIYDSSGTYVMSRSTVFDVSELKRVQRELEATNSELEAFSYSVSHDLRAPLRAVDGYARMLEEDYGERLDAEGRRLLDVVRASSTKMGHLIDDLLAFSRLSRQGLAKRPVDMTDLVDRVAQDLARANGGRRIDVAPLPPANGDPALLKQVWINLVGNALKYSAKRDTPRIEIAGRVENGETVYWVRDNGVGFDMRYAHKLFGVFQRLHRAEEFDGTGVGLAIVHRIVTRHGGRVWAEGEPDKGASFFFSLPRLPS